MPNQFNFNELGTTRSCVEDKCSFTGKVWNLPEDKQLEHFLEHFREAQSVVNAKGFAYEVQGEIRVQPCSECGTSFSQPRRRGRPLLKCEVCRG